MGHKNKEAKKEDSIVTFEVGCGGPRRIRKHGACYQVIKNLLQFCTCLFNFLVFVPSIIFIAFGLCLYYNYSPVVTFLNDLDPKDYQLEEIVAAKIKKFITPGLISAFGLFFIFTAIFLFIISCLGYFGTLCSNVCLIALFAVMNLLCVFIEIGVLVLVVFPGTVETSAKDQLKKSIEKGFKYHNPKNYTGMNDITAFWMIMHIQLHCCGVDSSSDFANLSADWRNKRGKQVVPESCCKIGKKGFQVCSENPTLKNSYYNTGCVQALKKVIKKNKFLMIASIAVLILFHMLLIALSIFFAIAFYKDFRDPYKNYVFFNEL